MKKAAQKKIASARRTSKKAVAPVDINRRREWRFDLPLIAYVEGHLPQGKKFHESAKLENISSSGAYFCLDSGVVVGSKLNLIIDLPKEITEGKKIKLKIGGMTIRLEKPNQKTRKQGVAVRFSRDFQFVPSRKK